MKVAISSGHGKYIRGASSVYGDEVDEARKVVEGVAIDLRSAGVEVWTFHDDVSDDQNENLNRIVDWHNSRPDHDLDVSVHFNANQVTTNPVGCETYFYRGSSGEQVALACVNAICEASGLKNRGKKDGSGLFFLAHTNAPAVLEEICFIDSKTDMDLYRAKFNDICAANAQAISGIDAGTDPGPVPPPVDDAIDQAVMAIAMKSEIAKYEWKDRSVAPPGYIKGFALAWAAVIRRYNAGDSAAREMAKRDINNPDTDALSQYAAEYEKLGMGNDAANSINTLRHLFALMLGLGMRESSGKHCEGRDTSADNVTSDTAEAGLYQTSYNANTFTSEFDKVMDAYAAGTYEGYLDAFEEGVTCNASSWASYGSGRGRQFQDMCKNEPAFAVETCALTLRNACTHYGPIKHKEAELKAEADWMLLDIQRYLMREGEA